MIDGINETEYFGLGQYPRVPKPKKCPSCESQNKVKILVRLTFPRVPKPKKCPSCESQNKVKILVRLTFKRKEQEQKSQ